MEGVVAWAVASVVAWAVARVYEEAGVSGWRLLIPGSRVDGVTIGSIFKDFLMIFILNKQILTQ